MQGRAESPCPCPQAWLPAPRTCGCKDARGVTPMGAPKGLSARPLETFGGRSRQEAERLPLIVGEKAGFARIMDRLVGRVTRRMQGRAESPCPCPQAWLPAARTCGCKDARSVTPVGARTHGVSHLWVRPKGFPLALWKPSGVAVGKRHKGSLSIVG
jgi:hypothetical protein